MESGTEPWSSFDSNLIPSMFSPRSGERTLVVCADDAGDFTLYQDVLASGDISQGQHFTASVWISSAIYGPEPEAMRLSLREAGGAKPFVDHDGEVSGDVGDEWLELTAEATVGEADRENLILIVWGLESGIGTCFAADDAAVYQDS